MNETASTKRRPGRPVTGNARTGAQRQDAYRKRQAARYMEISILRDDISALNAALAFAIEHGKDMGLEVSTDTLTRLTKQVDKAVDAQKKRGHRLTDAPPETLCN